MADSAWSSRNPEKFRRLADPPPGRRCGEGRDSVAILAGRLKFIDYATHLARTGGISDIVDPRPIVRIMGGLFDSRIRTPAGSSAKGRDLAPIRARPKFSKIPAYFGRTGGISDIVDPWQTA